MKATMLYGPRDMSRLAQRRQLPERIRIQCDAGEFSEQIVLKRCERRYRQLRAEQSSCPGQSARR
jgi:hypothetical protein